MLRASDPPLTLVSAPAYQERRVGCLRRPAEAAEAAEAEAVCRAEEADDAEAICWPGWIDGGGGGGGASGRSGLRWRPPVDADTGVRWWVCSMEDSSDSGVTRVSRGLDIRRRRARVCRREGAC